MREKRQFEVIESRQMDHLRVFHDVARALTSTLDVEHILHVIMQRMAQFFGPERWSLLMVDEATQELYYAIAVGEDINSLKDLRVPVGSGVAGWVAATGNPLIVPDVQLDPQWAAFAKKNPDLNIHSIACLPCRSEDKTVAVIQLLNSKLDLLSEYSISFLRILCDYAAIAIRNARAIKKIHDLSITDDCTGLFNARHLYHQLDLWVTGHAGAETLPRKGTFSVLFLDLDHFKNVNDTHGHQCGSRLLAEVGSEIRRQLGPEAAIFRYGGDEFVALLPEVSRECARNAAVELCERLREARFLESQGLSLSVLASIGVATYPNDAEDAAAILRAADRMMYEVKRTTRNNVAVAGQGLVLTGPVAMPEANPEAQPETRQPARMPLRTELHIAPNRANIA